MNFFDLVADVNVFLEEHSFEFNLGFEFRRVLDQPTRSTVLKVNQAQRSLFELTLVENHYWSNTALKEHRDAASDASKELLRKIFRLEKSASVLIWQVCISMEIIEAFGKPSNVPLGLASSSMQLARETPRESGSISEEFFELASERVELENEEDYDNYLATRFDHYEKDRRRYMPVIEFDEIKQFDRKLLESEAMLVDLVRHSNKIFQPLEVEISLRLQLPTNPAGCGNVQAVVDIYVGGEYEGSLALTQFNNWINFEIPEESIRTIDNTQTFAFDEVPYATLVEVTKDLSFGHYERLEREYYDRQLIRALHFLEAPLSLATQCAWFISEHGQSLDSNTGASKERRRIVEGIYDKLRTAFKEALAVELGDSDIAAWHIHYAREMLTEIQIGEYQSSQEPW